MSRKLASVVVASVAAAMVMSSAPAMAAAPTGVIGCFGAAPSGVVGTPGPFVGDVTVDWSGDPACAATDFEVQYKLANLGSSWSAPEATGSSWSAYVVSGLTPGQSYVFQVRAFYGSGFSDWSTQSPAVTALAAAPSGPSNVRAVASGASSVTVSWTAASPPPIAYQVQYRADRPGASWQPTRPLSTWATSIDVTDLTPGTGYFFQVRSSNGGSDVSSWVQSSTAVTPGAAPAKPTSVTATPSNASLVISWQMPLGATATGYQVQYSTDGVAWSPNPPVSTGSTTPSYTLTGLTNGVGYLVRVRAVNGPLTGDWTATTSLVTPLGLPSAPTGVTGVPGNAQVTLSWTAPVSSAAAPVTGYKVQYSSNSGASWTPGPTVAGAATTTVVVTGLSNGTGYIFQVRASNSAGDGPWSGQTGVITPPGVPDAPTAVVATADNGRATVSWTAPAAQASPVTGYRVTSSPGGYQCTTSAVPPDVPATSCTVTGLTNGTAYTFTVTATNAFGTGPASAASAPVTPTAPEVKIRIVGSGRDGKKVYANVLTQGLDKGTKITAMVRYTKGGAYEAAGQKAVKGDGTVYWTLTTNSKVWVYFVRGDAVSNSVTIPAR